MTKSAKKPSDVSIPAVVPGKALAAFLRVSTRTISNWTRDGTLKPIAGGYDLYNAVLAWAQRDFGSQRQALEAAKVEKLQRENKRASGKLIDADIHVQSITSLVRALNGWYNALPGRIAAEGAGKSVVELREIIRAECVRAKEEMAEAARHDFGLMPPDTFEVEGPEGVIQ